MYHSDFSVRIPEGKEVSGGYVRLPHNTQYRLVLRNNHDVRCDAYVEIDGEHVGTWRIENRDSITLERPAHDESRFTFFRANSREGRVGGLSTRNSDLGLVKVEFRPERQRIVYRESAPDAWRDSGRAKGLGGGFLSAGIPPSASPGGTALTGHSDQEFTTVANLVYDYDSFATIHLRLVCDEGAQHIKPLRKNATPVPPPIR